MTKQISLVLLVAAIAACGKKDGGGGGGAAAAPAAPLDVAGVNALVPAALKAKVVFEKRDVVLEQGKHPTTYTLAAPKDWKQQSKMFGNLDGGFGQRFSIGSNCNGECKPKDWAAESDKSDFQPLAKGKVLKDVKKPGDRVMIAEVEMGGMKTTTVVHSWWTEGDKSYHYCRAELQDELKDAAPAFEKACASVAIDGND